MTAVTVTERHPPILFILSGPSGVGKDSVIKGLRARQPDLHYAVTATTRAMRPGEVDGESYYFLTQDQYNALHDQGMLLAPANVHGNWYGAPLQPIADALDMGKDVLLKIDVQGAIQVRRRLPQAVFVFLSTPSPEILIERLRARHTESPDELERRIKDASFELAQLPRYDYCVVNREDDLDSAIDDLCCILSAERLRTHRQPITIEPS